MREIIDSIDFGDVFGLALLSIVVLQHAGTAGIHACMGRDGRTRHRAIEIQGAWRGTVALVVLLTPVGVVWALDAFSSPERFHLYMRANEAMLWLWIPITVVALTSFLIARVSPWQVRSNVNSMVFSVLELLRPAVAAAGMAIGAIATGDLRVGLVGAFAVLMGLMVFRLTRRWWYSKPVTLDDLGPAPRTA
ncbi:hypothetical protein [Demequina sp.]|uniref:hypothetical protein n=1 Tax=Demequina sp. TaxID=2050685 RepID=UPI0025E4EC9B|nr:hypothetical protein [Demequina sp.]